MNDCETWVEGDVACTLSVFDSGDTRATAIIITERDDVEEPETSVGECGCCPADPKPDSARYRACGNAVTVNVAQWVGERLMAVMFP